MPDLPALPDGLWEFIGGWTPHDPNLVPARIRMSRDVYNRVRANNPPPGSGAWPVLTFHVSTVNSLLGLAVSVDDHIEPGTWQVYAADNTLLRDSRSTNEVTS